MPVALKPTAKPTTLSKYQEWLRDVHAIDLAAEQSRFNLVVPNIKLSFLESPFWTRINDTLKTSDEKYKIAHNSYDLLDTLVPPELYTKSFDSFLLKTYRKNVVDNEDWPNGPLPKNRWVLPDNWYAVITDLVRTCFLVRYFDGVKTLAEAFRAAATSVGLEAELEMKARFDGYYGAHV